MSTIGKYQVLERVGEGAMGVVYKAHDPVLNRVVAVKVMSAGLGQDEVLRERFLREAQAAGSLQHPNLVTIYDFGETDGHLYIAMEFIEGADLEKLMLKQVQLDLPTKLDLIVDVLNGLSFAHRRGVIHRDIKPANIRIDPEGRARIMDFGIAKMSTSNLTGTGVMMGTPNYMAPEQITGDKSLTAAADLWAVGAVLYELLTNQRPFEADTLHRVLFKIVSDDPPPVRQAVPELPLALDEIVRKALAKEPENRYRSATEMSNALTAVRSTLSSAPRTTKTMSTRASIELEVPRATEKMSSTVVPAADAAPVAAAAIPALAAAQPSRPGWPLIGVGALVLLLAVGGVAYLGSRAGRQEQPTPVQTVQAPNAPAQATQTPTVPPPAAQLQATPDQTSRAAAPGTQAGSQATTASQLPRGRTAALPTTPPTRQSVQETRPATSTSAENQAANPPTQSASAPPTPQPQTQQPPPVVNPPAPTQQVTAPAPSSVSAPPPVTAPVATPENVRPAIEAALAEYARAIGTRQVAEVRRIYAGMTAQQQAAWEGFFASTRSMTATLDIASLTTGATNAVARVSGNYEFVTRAGRTERQPASFEATFAKEGERWVLQRIK